jgi:hypothetical protein
VPFLLTFLLFLLTYLPHNILNVTGTCSLSVHCGSIRQTASILSMSQECLRTGDKALVHFRFIKHPEYIKAGQRMVTQYCWKLYCAYFRQTAKVNRTVEKLWLQ